MEFNFGLDASFDNICDCKGIRKKARGVNGTKVYIREGLIILWLYKNNKLRD
jgi:hypothetical protein